MVELDRLIKHLSKASAYPALESTGAGGPDDVGAVDVIQTHGSVVFLIDDRVYKIKKPVDLGFLDYSTLEKRKAMCEAEVQINRTLADDVYLGVVPVTLLGDRLVVDGPIGTGEAGGEGHGEVVEWAVKMKRLPDEATLEAKHHAGNLDDAQLRLVAQTVSDFHRDAPTSPEISELGRFSVVDFNCNENFEQLGALIDSEALRAELDQVAELTRTELAKHRELIESRAGRGVPCDTHGDLRLDHVYLREGIAVPTIIDRIEFNHRFRWSDPISDIAFLIMDMQAHSGWREALVLEDAYFAAHPDDEGRSLLPLYVAYRATVRAKVAAMTAAGDEVPEPQRRAARSRVGSRLRLARGALAPPRQRTALVLVTGLPGTGKSVLSGLLHERAGFEWVRSDVIRKQLAGLEPTEPGSHYEGGSIYTQEWTDRTYGECLARAERALRAGTRVVVDATFIDAERRHAFVVLARRLGVPIVTLLCELDPSTARERLEARTGDASDADVAVYERARERIDAMTPADGWVESVSTDGTPDEAYAQAHAVLVRARLAR